MSVRGVCIGVRWSGLLISYSLGTWMIAKDRWQSSDDRILKYV
jgi:hypothetical protein